MNAKEEKDYIERFREGDSQAKELLIEHNMRLVAHIARKYLNTEEDMDDLISIGTIGLIKAVLTFNPDKTIRLASYASRCIENELLMYFRSKKKTNRDVSLYEPLGTDQDGNQITFADILESPERELWESVVLHKDIRRLYKVIPEILDQREQFIIRKRYGLYNTKPFTQREIAEWLGISRSYVSRIEKRALNKIKQSF